MTDSSSSVDASLIKSQIDQNQMTDDSCDTSLSRKRPRSPHSLTEDPNDVKRAKLEETIEQQQQQLSSSSSSSVTVEQQQQQQQQQIIDVNQSTTQAQTNQAVNQTRKEVVLTPQQAQQLNKKLPKGYAYVPEPLLAPPKDEQQVVLSSKRERKKLIKEDIVTPTKPKAASPGSSDKGHRRKKSSGAQDTLATVEPVDQSVRVSSNSSSGSKRARTSGTPKGPSGKQRRKNSKSRDDDEEDELVVDEPIDEEYDQMTHSDLQIDTYAVDPSSLTSSIQHQHQHQHHHHQQTPIKSSKKSKNTPKRRQSLTSPTTTTTTTSSGVDDSVLSRYRRMSTDMNSTDLSSSLRKCRRLLKTLMTHKFGWVFNQPVDPIALNIPDYFHVIKHPMDFGTIEARVDSGYYRDKDQFGNDVSLVFSNAMTYNPPGTDVHAMAATLKSVFDKKFPSIVEQSVDRPSKQERAALRLQQQQQQQYQQQQYQQQLIQADASFETIDYQSPKHEFQSPTTSSSLSSSTSLAIDPQFVEKIFALRASLGEVQQEIENLKQIDLQSHFPPPTPFVDPSASISPTPAIQLVYSPPPPPPPKPLTKEEKIRLSNSINNLAPENLGRVIEIIQESMPRLSEDQESDEIEIDLESLDDSTLRALQHYIACVKKKSSKKRSRSNQSMMSYRPSMPMSDGNTEKRIQDVQRRLKELDDKTQAITRGGAGKQSQQKSLTPSFNKRDYSDSDESDSSGSSSDSDSDASDSDGGRKRRRRISKEHKVKDTPGE